MTDDMDAFERHLAGVMRQTIRPTRPVDVAAIVGSATARTGRLSVVTRQISVGVQSAPPKEGFSPFSALKLVVAAAIVALFGSFLLAGVLTTQQAEDAGPAAAPSGPGVFSPAGSLERARAHHTATLLPDGRVLVIGGFDASNVNIKWVASAEVWDPATSSFDPAGRLTRRRDGHTAALLPDGHVLVIGGWGNSVTSTSVEAWDPETESFSPAGSLAGTRLSHTATLLPDGRILIAGGFGGGVPRNSAELWDPTSASSESAGFMAEGRRAHSATLLSDGRVLVVGGADIDDHTLASAEIWDPATGSFEPTGSLAEGREFHTSTLLPDGRVLVVGGSQFSAPSRISAELWDPATGSFRPAGVLGIGRELHSATLLPDGHVLIAGGSGGLSSAELWDPATESFSPAASLADGRWAHTATLLPDGRVLMVGGGGPASTSRSAEVWAPNDGMPPVDEDGDSLIMPATSTAASGPAPAG